MQDKLWGKLIFEDCCTMLYKKMIKETDIFGHFISVPLKSIFGENRCWRAAFLQWVAARPPGGRAHGSAQEGFSWLYNAAIVLQNVLLLLTLIHRGCTAVMLSKYMLKAHCGGDYQFGVHWVWAEQDYYALQYYITTVLGVMLLYSECVILFQSSVTFLSAAIFTKWCHFNSWLVRWWFRIASCSGKK